jgi:hypothetical protein
VQGQISDDISVIESLPAANEIVRPVLVGGTARRARQSQPYDGIWFRQVNLRWCHLAPPKALRGKESVVVSSLPAVASKASATFVPTQGAS